MAFSSLSAALFSVGKPIIKALFQTIKDNSDDANSRLLTIEASANKVTFFNGPMLSAGSYSSATGLLFYRIESAIDLTDCKVGIYAKGAVTSGTLSVDVQKASGLDFAASVSVFTTLPSLDLSIAADYTESSNMVLSASNKILTEGDYIRVDISSLPLGLGRFQLYLIGEPS